ncbi:hypothetical protein FJY90_07920 [Candidatus Gottesmanbacteria bacterium]|nr:hypothetical protein [Candidatus Gottesmanbacteria bacterium]
MAKGTTIFILILAVLASLLFGINIGKKLGKSEIASVNQATINNQQLTITPIPSLTITSILTLSSTPTATSSGKISGITTYTDKSCGFSFSYPGSFIRQKTVNSQSVIFTDPDNPNLAIAAACAASIPRPPVASEKIESLILDGVAGILYHDQNPDGSPRDEVIVKHPDKELEIIIAGYGDSFTSALTSFKFTQ